MSLQSTTSRYRPEVLDCNNHPTDLPQTLFIESACNDQHIIEENVRSVKISSPDVSGFDLSCHSILC